MRESNSCLFDLDVCSYASSTDSSNISEHRKSVDSFSSSTAPQTFLIYLASTRLSFLSSEFFASLKFSSEQSQGKCAVDTLCGLQHFFFRLNSFGNLHCIVRVELKNDLSGGPCNSSKGLFRRANNETILN